MKDKASKEREQEEARAKVERGEATWAEINRANFFASSVIHLYRMKKGPLGLPREESKVETILTPYVTDPIAVRASDGPWRQFVTSRLLLESLEHGLRMGRKFFLRPAPKDWS